jgi:hypothetical protein
MAHLWNATVVKERDCSGGQYHNKHFKTAAERFGLEVSRDGKRGWAYTKLTDISRDAIEQLKIDEMLFNGLKRKTIKKSEDRYFSLIVNLDLKQPLKDALEVTGCSQRQFVEAAIENAIAAVK